MNDTFTNLKLIQSFLRLRFCYRIASKCCFKCSQSKPDLTTLLQWSAFKCKSGKTYFSAKKEGEDEDDGYLNTTFFHFQNTLTRGQETIHYKIAQSRLGCNLECKKLDSEKEELLFPQLTTFDVYREQKTPNRLPLMFFGEIDTPPPYL